jgi:outer membrane lipoprotein-sorting protein
MTRHRSRYPIALLLVALTGCSLLSRSGPLAPPPPATGTDVLQRMSSRYEGKWFQTLQFTQENTRYAANGRTERSQWKEYMLVPGRLRIEFMPATGGNGAVYADGNVYSFEGGKLARTAAQVNILLVLTADVYAQPVAMSSRQLAALGVDLTKLRSDMWNDRKVWVVGSTIATDLATPQFWVDADTWVVLRVIERAAQGTASAPRPSTEYRLGDYRVLSGVPVVHEIQFLRDGQPFFKEQYTDVQLNTAIDARLFSASQWKIPVRTP